MPLRVGTPLWRECRDQCLTKKGGSNRIAHRIESQAECHVEWPFA